MFAILLQIFQLVLVVLLVIIALLHIVPKFKDFDSKEYIAFIFKSINSGYVCLMKSFDSFLTFWVKFLTEFANVLNTFRLTHIRTRCEYPIESDNKSDAKAPEVELKASAKASEVELSDAGEDLGNTLYAQAIDDENTRKVESTIKATNSDVYSSLQRTSNSWKKGNPKINAEDAESPNFTEIERNRVPRIHRVPRDSQDSSVSSDTKKFMTHDEVVSLISKAIERANKIFDENENIYFVDINAMIFDDFDGRNLNFNPLNLTKSEETVKHWTKFFKTVPISNKKINDLMFENTKILVVYTNTGLIKKVLYGYELEIREKSYFVV